MDDASARTTRFVPDMDASGSQSADPLRRAHAAARLGVLGDFMRVSQLAAALGMPANSIYAQIRHGTFPIPHRRVGNVVVVKLDDYVDWYSDTAPTTAPASLRGRPAALASRGEPQSSGAAARPIETDKQQADRIRRQVDERMVIRGFARPRKK